MDTAVEVGLGPRQQEPPVSPPWWVRALYPLACLWVLVLVLVLDVPRHVRTEVSREAR